MKNGVRDGRFNWRPLPLTAFWALPSEYLLHSAHASLLMRSRQYLNLLGIYTAEHKATALEMRLTGGNEGALKRNIFDSWQENSGTGGVVANNENNEGKHPVKLGFQLPNHYYCKHQYIIGINAFFREITSQRYIFV